MTAQRRSANALSPSSCVEQQLLAGGASQPAAVCELLQSDGSVPADRVEFFQDLDIVADRDWGGHTGQHVPSCPRLVLATEWR